MSAYIVGVYRHTSREGAERADRMCAPSHEAESADTEIHDTPPVILGGLVKGGIVESFDEWDQSLLAPHRVLVDATGRAIPGSLRAFRSAAARGALPITWYHYEAP